MSEPSVHQPNARGDSAEICAICGNDAGGRAFCHYFEGGHRIVLCSPKCAEKFLHGHRDGAADQSTDLSRNDYDRAPSWWR